MPLYFRGLREGAAAIFLGCALAIVAQIILVYLGVF